MKKNPDGSPMEEHQIRNVEFAAADVVKKYLGNQDVTPEDIETVITFIAQYGGVDMVARRLNTTPDVIRSLTGFN